MTDLTFETSWEQGTGVDPLEAATYGTLGIRLGAVSITEVHDDAARTTRKVIRVSAYPLALWLASGWWRLRWEGPRRDTDWMLSHQLAGAGGGYVWPHVTFVSDGELIHVEVQRRARTEWEPVSYLNDMRTTVSASHFEAEVGAFIDTVLARLAEIGHQNTALSKLWSTVQSERRDMRVAASRRLEALLGFDAEEAPAELLSAYARGAETFGAEAVAEFAATAANGTVPDWEALSKALDDGVAVRIREFQDSRSMASRAVRNLSYPWQRGEAAARAVREVIATPGGPLTNEMMRDWMGADPAKEGTTFAAAAVARREQPDAPDLTICYRSKHQDGRRFEIARLLGDHLIAASPQDSLLPATRAKTARQSLQRAFAAELLLRWKDLAERVGDDPDDEVTETTAREFGVSPLVVRTRLVAKSRLSVDALDFD
ncbi:MAG: hypothetical protein AB1726_08320 [Planctomycetota bacterium]